MSSSLVAFWLRVLLMIVCLAFGLFGNKFLIIQKKNLSDTVIAVLQISTTRGQHFRKGVIPSLPLKRVSYNGAFIPGSKRVFGDAIETTNAVADFEDSGVVANSVDVVSSELQSTAPMSSRPD